MDVVKGTGFKYWFTNVFWYHYRIHLFVGLFVLALVGYFIYDMATREHVDFRFTIITGRPAHPISAEVFAEILREYYGLSAQGQTLIVGGEQGDFVVHQQVAIAMADSHVVLMIMGESMLGIFEGQWDVFTYLGDLPGISEMVSDISPQLIDVSDTQLITDLGLTLEPMYAIVKLPPVRRDGSPIQENIDRHEAVLGALNIFIDYTGPINTSEER